MVGIVSRANLLQVLARANDNTDWVESDRVLHQRFIDSIKDQPWAGRPFNIIVNDRCADLWGFVYSVDEKTAVRVAAEATPGIEFGIGSFGHRIPNFRDLTIPLYSGGGSTTGRATRAGCRHIISIVCWRRVPSR